MFFINSKSVPQANKKAELEINTDKTHISNKVSDQVYSSGNGSELHSGVDSEGF
jgi:hypothetical protein